MSAGMLLSIIESEFDLGVGYLNHCIIIVNESGEHGVPPHSPTCTSSPTVLSWASSRHT